MMKNLRDETIQKLNELNDDYREQAHILADSLLITYLIATGHADVAEAWQNACDRVGFWYA